MSLKRIYNTSVSGIEITETGDYIDGSSGFIDVYPQNYGTWAAAIESSSGLQELFNSNTLVAYDGMSYLNASAGIDYMRYPHEASSVRFKTSPYRINSYRSKTTQEALEEIDFRQETKEPTGFVDRTQCTISWSDANRRLTIAPVSTSFTYFVKGREYVKTSTETVDITDTEGTWFIYYVNDILTASQTPWVFDSGAVFVSIIHWDSTNNKAILFGEERHGLTMDWATHKYMHQVHGAEVEYGTFLAGDYILGQDGSLDSHAQLSIADGRVHDEDLIHEIINSATPTNPFEQKLSTIAYLPMYYRNGANGDWRKIDATAFAVAHNSPNTCFYNKIVTGSWTLVNATEGWIIASWIFATNNIYEPIICVVGQMQSSDLSEAASDDFFTNLDLGNFPFVEAKLLYRAFFRTSTLYTNTPKAILASIDGLLIPNIVPSPVVNYKITSGITFTTLSNTDVLITGMTVTPQSGNYAVWFSSDLNIVQNNALVNTSIYKAGVQISDSERTNQGSSSNFQTQAQTITTVSVDGTEQISVRVRVSKGQLDVNGRTLLLIRLGA